MVGRECPTRPGSLRIRGQGRQSRPDQDGLTVALTNLGAQNCLAQELPTRISDLELSGRGQTRLRRVVSTTRPQG